MFFKKKPEIEKALKLINDAHTIVISCKRNKSFIPNKYELEILKTIQNEFQSGYAMTSYVSMCLKQRIEKKSEGSTKFNSKKAFDYHYPEK